MKNALTLVTVIIATASTIITSNPAHAENVKPNKKYELVYSTEITDNVIDSIKKEKGLNDDILITNHGKPIKFSIKQDDSVKKSEQKLFAVVVSKKGDLETNSYVFDEVSKLTTEEITEQVDKMKSQRELSELVQPLTQKMAVTASATATYSDDYTWTFRDQYNSDAIMGTYISNVDYIKGDNVTLNGRANSVWDVKYFNQVTPMNGYQTKEVRTRSSVEDYPSETLRSYGPLNNAQGGTLTVALSGLIPTVQWEFNNSSVQLTDTSSLSGKYGRWSFKPALGGNIAKSVYVTKPGARFTNYSGNMGVQHSHVLEFYKNLSANDIGQTGIHTRFLPDR